MSVNLNTGASMPIIGLGTHKVVGLSIVRSAIFAAFEAGYRSIDTASVYRNEADIGSFLPELMKNYSLERKDLFITSKLGPKDQGSGKCRSACLNSLKALGLDYLDLYLIHWPGASGMQPEDARNEALRLESWREMEKLYDEGILKAIGVSNYTEKHLETLLERCRVEPSVLQVEYHPQLVQKNLLEFCRNRGIHLQAYSSLGSSSSENRLLTNEVVSRIAKECNKSESQVLLRWSIQQSIGVIPKSVNPQHIKENIAVFDFNLTSEQMATISNLHSGHHYCWNPENVA